MPEVISYVCTYNCENVTAVAQHVFVLGWACVVLHLLQQYSAIQEQEAGGLLMLSHCSWVIVAVGKMESHLGERVVLRTAQK